MNSPLGFSWQHRINEKKVVEDIDMGDGSTLGNGGSDTVYRLREGIERFLIQNINDPGATARAQSDIWIMGDSLGTDSSMFNHVPGGANILYLDGHTTFVKYPSGGHGPAPVNDLMAAFSTAVSSGFTS